MTTINLKHSGAQSYNTMLVICSPLNPPMIQLSPIRDVNLTRQGGAPR